MKRVILLLLVCAFAALTGCKPEAGSGPATKKGEDKSAPSASTQTPGAVATGWGKAGDLYPVLKGGKYGFIDNSGKMVIEPKFLYATRFIEDLALVIDEKKKTGFIDRQGKYVIESKYDGGVPFSEGYATVRVRDKAGVIDKSGKVVIEPAFDRIGRFHDGLAPAVVVREHNGVKAKDGGYLNTSGKFAIHPQFDPNLTPFTEGVAGVRKLGQLWSFIDRNEKPVIKPGYFQVGQFSEGMAAVMDAGSRWGFIDKTGKPVITNKFDSVAYFSDGMCAVRLPSNKKWGYIDTKGDLAIKEQFDYADVFIDGVAIVQVERKVGYIDKSGKYVWPLSE